MFAQMTRAVLALAATFMWAAAPAQGASPTPSVAPALSAAPAGGVVPAASTAPAETAVTPTEPVARAAGPARTTELLEVAPALAASPLDQPRHLQVPAGFGIRVLARVSGARFMLALPDGDLLVSDPETGTLTRVHAEADSRVSNSLFASGLNKPHDMVLTSIDGRSWLYVAETHRVSRTLYKPGQARLGALTTVVDNLPNASTPELHGRYGHQLKNIAIGRDHTLYVAIASTCNACDSDARANPVRGSIYRYDADGRNGRLFARGIRNAEGLDIEPASGRLWAVVNNRDNIAVPWHRDVDGDGQDDYGKVLPSFIDEHPVEPFIEVTDAANFGWPYCNPIGTPPAAPASIEYVADAEFNADGSKLDCRKATPIAHGLHAHSAPLGFSFLQSSKLPASIRDGAAIALHGCWNCTRPFGYKVVLVRFDGKGRPTSESDLVAGFADTDRSQRAWGRPVDVAVDDRRGSLLISDDRAGAIYELYPKK